MSLPYSPNRQSPLKFNVIRNDINFGTGGVNFFDPFGAGKWNVVQDVNASTGYAVEWNTAQVAAAPFGFQVQNINYRGGQYRVSVRVKSTVTPPGGAALFGQVQSQGQSFNHTWDLTSLDNNYQVFTFDSGSIDPRPISGGFEANLAMKFLQGFDGLVLDYISLEQLTEYTDTQQLAFRNLTGWTASGPPTVTSSNNVWHGEGMYFENFKVTEAVQAIGGITYDQATWFANGSSRGFNSFGLTTATIMAGYKLLIINNLDMRTFYYDARDWMRGYVNAGGRILFLGGVYGLGRGFWHESDLISQIMPVTLSAFDLQKLATPQVVQTVNGTIYSSNFTGSPVCLWNHNLTPVSGAATHMTVGGNPALVTKSFGSGKVAVLGLTPLGVIDTNSVWWQDGQWQSVAMQPLINWLLT